MTRRTRGDAPRPTAARRLRRTAVAYTAALTVTLSGCGLDLDGSGDASPGPTGATVTPTPTPQPPRTPEKGDCHQLTWDEALAPTADTEPDACKGATAITFYVGTLRKRADGTPHEVDSRVVATQLSKACPRELRAFLGGTKEQRRLSLLTTVWFTPTLEEQAAGADWYRCDLVAPLPSQKLLKVKRGMRNSVAEGRAGTYELCAKGEAGTPSFKHVPCSRKHTWKAVSTVELGGDTYPGSEEVARRMADPCTDAATRRARDPLNVRWTQEGPTEEQWNTGQRYGVCWLPA